MKKRGKKGKQWVLKKKEIDKWIKDIYYREVLQIREYKNGGNPFRSSTISHKIKQGSMNLGTVLSGC